MNMHSPTVSSPRPKPARPKAHATSTLAEFDRAITAIDIAGLLGMPVENVSRVLRHEDLEGLLYRELTTAERTAWLQKARDALTDDVLQRTGPERQARWQAGWQEVLDRVDRDGVSAESVMPQYFRHDTLRLNGRYIRVPDGTFEYRLHRALCRVIFSRYVLGADRVVELGCGTGANLLLLRDMFPDTPLVGCDWAKSSQEIVTEIDAAKGNIAGANLDMLTMEGADRLPVTADTAVVTLHALEQLGNRFGPLLAFLMDAGPRICVHLEPIAELYDPNNEFDSVALEYHNKRNYLSGFLTELRELENASRVEILAARRTGFGSPFQEAYSLIVWRPTV